MLTSSCEKERKAESSPPCRCACHSQSTSNEAATSANPGASCSSSNYETGSSVKPGSPLTNTGNFTHRQLKICPGSKMRSQLCNFFVLFSNQRLFLPS